MRVRLIVAVLTIVCLIVTGCATPPSTQTSRTRVIAPDQEDGLGGSFVESSDVRTVASKMCPAILSIPEIARSADATLIAVHPMRNSTRYVFDKDIFVKRLRLELNRVSRGRVRFIDPRAARRTTMEVVRERDEYRWERLVEEAAAYIAGSELVSGSEEPVTVAIKPVSNTNLVEMNADGFNALLRAKMSEKASGKVVFLAPGAAEESHARADYFLTGEFIAESIKEEDLDRTTVYAVTGGKSSVEVHTGRSEGGEGGSKSDVDITRTTIESTELTPIAEAEESPNVAKYLNVMLVDPATQEVKLEKRLKVESVARSGLGRAELVLTGEISGLSKAVGGDRSDYVLMTFQLIRPETNEVLWEDAYETKRVSSRSAVYK